MSSSNYLATVGHLQRALKVNITHTSLDPEHLYGYVRFDPIKKEDWEWREMEESDEMDD